MTPSGSEILNADDGTADDAGRFGSDLRVVLALSVGPLVGLGLGRFAYALLLPPMRSELHWTFAVAGAVGTANAGGYLVGAVVAAPLAQRFGSRAVFATALGIVTVGLLTSAISDLLPVIVALRLLVDIAGASCFVVGGGLAAEIGRRHSHRRSTMLLAIYFAGCGLGIVGPGIVVPAVLAASSAAVGWRFGWCALGLLALAVAIISLRTMLRAPEPTRADAAAGRWRPGALAAVLVSYFLYGAGYIAYMTFIVALLADRGGGPGEITVFWIVLGACSVCATFLWGPLLRGREVASVSPACSLWSLSAPSYPSSRNRRWQRSHPPCCSAVPS